MAGEHPRLRVLVVDDDQGMTATLSDILGASGYEVETAASGVQALDLVRQCPPDCVLMDIRMPQLDGVETFRRLKEVAPDSFVIFMTAYSESRLVAEARAEGAIEVLPKPLDIERLLRLIAETAERIPVLVVDDDPAFCRSLGDALAAHSFEVSLAQTPQEAVRRFAKVPRGAVLLDMKLNGEDGLAVLQRLKRLNPNATVLLMTGYSELVDDMRRGLELSAAGCLTKPLELEWVVTMIREEAGRRGAGPTGPA